MVNDDFTIARPPDAQVERELILSYAPPRARDGLAALVALDDTLAGVLRSTREPMVGQMRLTWWHDALSALDTRPAPAHPVLQALAAEVVASVDGKTLATLVEGWEELLDPDPLDAARMRTFAAARGTRLFEAAGRVLGVADDPLAAGGAGWALADLATNLGDPADRARARDLAAPLLDEARHRRWSRNGRALGAMVHLAAMPGRSPPRRAARALLHRLTGR